MLSRIENHWSYGKAATGKTLADEFGGDPYGWSFEAVQLFVLCLLRAGKIDVTSKGQTLESALSVETKNVFGNNNLFRAASLRPKQSLGFEELVKAADAFQKAFGKEIGELEQGAVARAIRDEVAAHEDFVREQENVLKTNRLPGSDALTQAINQMRAIRSASEENTILNFNGSHAEIKEAIKRAKELEQAITEPVLATIDTARAVIDRQWPFIETEPDVEEDLRKKAGELADLLSRETFFRQLAQIDQYASAIQKAYTTRFDEAGKTRCAAYKEAVSKLGSTSGWDQIAADQQQRIAQPLTSRANSDVPKATPIPQLRADIDACSKRLQDAIEQVLKAIEGTRLVQVNAGSYFKEGVETEEQLDNALSGLREECAKHVGEGKKVFLRSE